MSRDLAVSRRRLLRVFDANLNRAREGLRVCEEIARLVLEDPALTRRCQRLRHGIHRAGSLLGGPELLAGRDADGDVGRPGRRGPARTHRVLGDLLTANLRRVQEALRVLEEFGRLHDTRTRVPGTGRGGRYSSRGKRLFLSAAAGRAFGMLRFRSYSLEKEFHSRLPALRHR